MQLGLAGNTKVNRSPDLILGGIISGASILLYLAFRQRFLYHTDSIGFARAIHHFNMALHQPAPPGYLLYILSLRVVERLTNLSDNDTMIVVSIVVTAAAVFLFFALARSWLSNIEAGAVTLLFASSPVVWFNSDIAMAYACGLLGSVAVAFVAYQACRQGGRYFYALPVVWGLAAGFRPELAVILAPLVLLGAYPTLRRDLWQGVALVGLAVLTFAVWFIPLLRLAGGLSAFRELMAKRADVSIIFPMLLHHQFYTAAQFLTKNTIVTVAYLALGIIGVVSMQLARGAKSSAGSDRPVLFLLLWIVPGVLLDMFTTISHSGYVLPFLPAVLLLLWPNGRLSGLAPALRTALIVVSIAFQGAYFLLMPQLGGILTRHWAPDVLERGVLDEPARSRLVQDDVTTAALVSAIRSDYPSDQTLLIVPVGEEIPRDAPLREMYAHAQYYLPDWHQRVLYTARLLVFDMAQSPPFVTADVTGSSFNLVYTNVITIPNKVRWLVWFCDSTYQAYPWDSSWQRVAITPDVTMVVADVSGTAPPQRTWGPWKFRKAESSKGQ